MAWEQNKTPLAHLTFVSLYGYNSDEPEMFNEIMKNIASYSNTKVIIFWLENGKI
jgi:hypothetical protein